MSKPTPTGQGSINNIGAGSIPGVVICAYDVQYPWIRHTLTFLNPRISPNEICTGESYTYQRFYNFSAREYSSICAKLNAGETVHLFGKVTVAPFMDPTGWM